nr:hypothetical protein [Tanacetum cinerariifolium]
EVQEVVEVVTAAKLVYEVTASSETVTAISVIIPAAEPQVPAATIIAAPTRVTAALSRKRKGVVIRDPKSNLATSSIIFAKTKSKDKGMSYDDIRPIFKAKFNSNMDFLLKSEEQMEE